MNAGDTISEGLTHFDEQGRALMVDVTHKAETSRTAIASEVIRVGGKAMQATAAKGAILVVARIAGIMAVKQTSSLIPLCHPLPIGKVTVDFHPRAETGEVKAICTVKATGQTGVKMEALTGVIVALPTIYAMCKVIDKRMEITSVHLCKKAGGKSGVESMAHGDILTFEEIVRIVCLASELGMRVVRVIGGEPMARRWCLEIGRASCRDRV